MINTRKIKKATSFILIAVLLISLCVFSASAVGDPTYDFPNFSEADSMAFVEEQNIEIPSGLQQLDSLPAFTQKLILQAYQTPNMPFGFNAPDTQSYAEAIRFAVRSCLDLASLPMIATTVDSLRHNTIQDADGNWAASGGIYDPKWANYNCYAFAINRAEQPGFYNNTEKQYQPGDMGESGYFVGGMPVETLAEIIRDDLLAMGYSNISLSYSIPTINSSQELICVRTMNVLDQVDYHFMRYDLETDAWYHKPDDSAVLKYNYVPSNDRVWYVESYDPQKGLCSATTVYYDSPIVFITYSKNQINVGGNNTSREYIQPWKDVFCEINVGSSGYYDISLESDYAFDYDIYNDEFDILSTGTGTSIDVCQTFTGGGKYYLRMNFVSHDQRHYVDYSITSHTHSYTGPYKWLSFTQHDSTCNCGITSGSPDPHVVPLGSFTGGNRYATCMLCRGLATFGMTTDSVNDLPHTDAGSYILPNGVIVLAPEDMEAYMNGTLVFRVGETE